MTKIRPPIHFALHPVVASMVAICSISGILSAQMELGQVGGRIELLHYVHGYGGWYTGIDVAGVGDVDADGYDDFIAVRIHGSDVSVYSGATGDIIFNYHTKEAGPVNVGGIGDVNQDGFADFVIGITGIVVGGIPETGAVRVYSGSTGEILFRIDGNIPNEDFGDNVSGIGDVNGDGSNDFLYRAKGGPFFRNMIFVHSGSSGTLLFQFEGWSASGAGDVNGEGFADILVSGVPITGYPTIVYSGLTGAEILRIDNPVGETVGAFTVSDLGDVDADGVPDVILGYLGGLGSVGSVYVISGVTGSPILHFPGEYDGSLFGISVSGAGDIDQDGYPDLIIGAPWHPTKWENGAAFLFSGRTGELIVKFAPLAPERARDFGRSVDDAGDVNGDGFPDIIIGAPNTHGLISGLNNAGSFVVATFLPFLSTSTREISASVGGIQDLKIDFPPDAGLANYRVLISFTGIGPTHFGVDIPLSLDYMSYQSFRGVYPIPTHSDMHGILDANGDALASFSVAPGWLTQQVGGTFWVAAIAAQAGHAPEFSSVAIPMTIVP